MSAWKLVLDGRYPSRSNMGRDSRLLESVVSGGSPGALRVYNWSEPAVTLGFHQHAFTPRDPGLEIPILKRPTGGGAVLHADDFTFSLSTRETGVFSRGIVDSCRVVTSVFARALRACGLDAEMRGESMAFSSVCFLRTSPVELCIDGSKVLGLAALRSRGCLLMQGVMPLTADRELSRRVFGDDACPRVRALRDHVPEFREGVFLENLVDAFASETDILFLERGDHDGQQHDDHEREVHLRGKNL